MRWITIIGREKLFSKIELNVRTAIHDYNDRYRPSIESGKKDPLTQRRLAECVFSQSKITYARKYSKLNQMLKGNENMPLQVFLTIAGVLEVLPNELLTDNTPPLPQVQSRAINSTGTRMQWDQEAFFQEAEKKLSVEEIKAVKKLYDFSKKTADEISWGTERNGSYGAIFNKVCPRSIYSVYTNGTILLNFTWMKHDKKMRRYRDKLRRKLNTLISLSNNEEFPGIIISNWKYKTRDLFNVIESTIKS